MTIFDALNTASTPPVEEAEVKLDLRGIEKEKALEKLDHIVRYCKKTTAKTLYVFFDPARPGAGETLFQPVARYFKFEKFNGYIKTAKPVMTENSGGFYIEFTG
jgi:hypothetical protein